MWLCEGCWNPERHIAFSTRPRVLACSRCKARRRCFLAVRK